MPPKGMWTMTAGVEREAAFAGGDAMAPASNDREEVLLSLLHEDDWTNAAAIAMADDDEGCDAAAYWVEAKPDDVGRPKDREFRYYWWDRLEGETWDDDEHEHDVDESLDTTRRYPGDATGEVLEDRTRMMRQPKQSEHAT